MSDLERKNRIAALRLAIDALAGRKLPGRVSTEWPSITVLRRMMDEMVAEALRDE